MTRRFRFSLVAVPVVACIAVAAISGGGRPVHAEAPSKVRIAFIGDSTSDGLWSGMTQVASRDACLKERLELLRRAQNSTGLTRPDRFDWAVETKKIGTSAQPHLFVMSLGLNDTQSVAQKGRPLVMDHTAEYPARYKERVTEVLRSAQETKTPLRWVGLPALRSPAADKEARFRNVLFAEAIGEFGDPTIKYIEPWRLTQDGEDRFQSYGPDQNGRMVQLRASDGVHFTNAGDTMVSVYLLPKILASLAESGNAVCSKTEGQPE